jgi:hypothetical protein
MIPDRTRSVVEADVARRHHKYKTLLLFVHAGQVRWSKRMCGKSRPGFGIKARAMRPSAVSSLLKEVGLSIA